MRLHELPSNENLIIGFAILGAVCVLLAAFSGRGRRRNAQNGVVPWFSRPTNRPAVYLIRSAVNPRLIKVGYTARRVETRMSEIAQEKGPVQLLFSLRMPHAFATEQAAHRAMRRARGVRHAGGEWYFADPKRARKIILREARRVRGRARRRFSWPKAGEIFVWKDL